jgi:hypothetical protein
MLPRITNRQRLADDVSGRRSWYNAYGKDQTFEETDNWDFS